MGVFHATDSTWPTRDINFHGLHVAFPDLPQVHALPGTDADAPRTWWTLADVADCPDLELTLPARTAIVQTPFTAEFVDEATRIIYRAIAAAGQAPRLGYETRTRAAAAGITLPDDPRHLTPWGPANAYEDKLLEHPRHPDLQHAILVDDDQLDAAESQTLAWAAKESGTLGRSLGDRERATGLPVVRRSPVHHRCQRAYEERDRDAYEPRARRAGTERSPSAGPSTRSSSNS